MTAAESPSGPRSSGLPAAAAATALAIVWAVLIPVTADAFPRLHADPLVWLDAVVLPLVVVGVLSHASTRAAHSTTRWVLGVLVAGFGLIAVIGTVSLVDSVVAPDSDSSSAPTPMVAWLVALTLGAGLVAVSIVVGWFPRPARPPERTARLYDPDVAASTEMAPAHLVERWALAAVVVAVGLVAAGGVVAAAEVHSDPSAPGGCGSVVFARSTGGLPCDDDRNTAALVAGGLAGASLVLSTAALVGARGLRSWRRSSERVPRAGARGLRAVAAVGVLAALALVGTEVTAEAGTHARCGAVIDQLVDAGSPDNGPACLSGYQERTLGAGALAVGAAFALGLATPALDRGARAYTSLGALARAGAVALSAVVVLNGSWFEVAVAG